MLKKTPYLLVLSGATAVGKTQLAIEWAQRFNGEIVGADSRQLYRYMDIGTAKPSAEDQATVPHHLIDVVNPDETLTLAQFQDMANTAILDIQGRGKLPLLVGGTGMYITAVLEGWQMPEVPPNPELRAELEAMSKEQLLEKLQALDPAAAATIDTQNPRRLVRAVEVCIIAGRPFSEMRRKKPPNYNVLHYALTMPRDQLYARADVRVDLMLQAGWIEEVRHLIDDLGYDPKLPAMSALGYPEIAAVLRGDLTLDQAREQIKNGTHHFIRRQYTWLRGHDTSIQWIEPGQDVTGVIAAWLE